MTFKPSKGGKIAANLRFEVEAYTPETPSEGWRLSHISKECYHWLMAGEQAKIERAKLLDDALTAPGNLTDVYDRFWEYSLTNMLLFPCSVYPRGIHEPVAAFSQWKASGRHIVPGARAKRGPRIARRRRMPNYDDETELVLSD